MYKKLLKTVSVGIMVAMLFTACGSNKDTTTNANNNTNATTNSDTSTTTSSDNSANENSDNSATTNNDTSTTNSNASPNTSATVSEEDGTTYMGEVKEISDTEITIAIGTRKEVENGNMPSGAPSGVPSGAPSGAPEQSGDTTKQGKNSEGQNPGGQNPGGQGQGGQEMPSMLELTGEEATLKITENTKVVTGGRDNQTEGSVSDIETGSIVTISYDEESGEALEISVNNFGMGGQGGPSGS